MTVLSFENTAVKPMFAKTLGSRVEREKPNLFAPAQIVRDEKVFCFF
jgi:hypothetical protein